MGVARDLRAGDRGVLHFRMTGTWAASGRADDVALNELTATKLINDQPAVVRADRLEAAVAERWGGGLEGPVPRRRAPAPVASPADGGSR